MSTNQRDTLRAAIANADSFQAQVAAVTALDEFDRHQREAHKTAASNDWADTTVRQTLSPVAVHERSTIETDWLGEAKTASAEVKHAAMAEAAMWFGRTSAEVRADVEEFGIQAEGFMRRVASAYGEDMESVYSEGLSYIGFMHRQAASGLDQVQQTVDPHENPKTTPLDPSVFDNFADEVHPINAGVVGTETSERNPLLQQIEQEGSGQGQSEVPGGHSTGNEPTGPSAPFGDTVADSGPLGTTSVAISHTMNLDQFRAQMAAEAASGLDQVQQVVDSQENPKPTPLNEEVQFPWLISPDAYGNGGDSKEKDVEHSASRLPFDRKASAAQAMAKSATLKQAGGDFDAKDTSPSSSSWYDHPDYDKHYQYGVDSSKRYGEPTQFRDHEDDDTREEWGGEHAIHDLTRGEWEHHLDHPDKGNGAGMAFMDGWSDHSGGDPVNLRLRDQWRAGRHGQPPKRWNQASLSPEAAKKVADMFGNSDAVHPVALPDVANSPTTTPDLSAGSQQGLADGLAGDQPTYADASSSAPVNVQQYSKGYEQGAKQRKDQATHEVVPSLSAAASKVSERFTKAASREDGDFKKGYNFATKWAPGKPLVTTGSALFESGLFAGVVDGLHVGSEAHRAWRTAHRTHAEQDPQFGTRLETHDSYLAHLVNHGIDVTAATSIDLDTLDAASSPSATGNTPINGPGTPPPLEGGVDPARPGGPSPYNGAAPAAGKPVVPTGPAPAAPGSNLINDVPGGPADGNSKAFAFRRQVQAGLLQAKQQKKG